MSAASRCPSNSPKLRARDLAAIYGSGEAEAHDLPADGLTPRERE